MGMLSIEDIGSRLCDGLTRREWLRLGGLSAFGLSMPLLARSSAPASGSFGKAKSCIVLFHLGGPPQQETWDMKPDAPAGIRGDYKPIATNVTGIQVCELMPRTAKHLDKICVLRAMSTNDNAHSSSGYWMLTGVPHQPTQSENAKPGAPNDWPCTAAIVQRLRAGKNGLPASIVVPEHIWNTGNLSWPGQDGGFLGRTADPWLIPCQPHKPGFQISALSPPADVSAERLSGRLSLLSRVNKRLEALDRAGGTSAYDHKSRQALNLLAGSRGRAAFELDREPRKLRERYGMTRWGQSLLLARRLVESGVSLVQVNWTRMEGETNDSPAWDTHQKNALHLKRLMPVMDAAYSALLEDLSVRGLLDSTLIVWMGEFGRTPRINGGGGRDHWGHVFSATLAGGGVRGGQVIGSSDKIAGHPRDGRVLPQDLQATVFHCLGLESHTEVRDTQGRPVAITRGEVIRQAV
jgi:Protein of unknown function (DUF1501)